MKRHAILLAALALMPLALAAQDIHTEVTVDRVIVPVERPATRLASVAPAFAAPRLRMPQLASAEYSRHSDVTPLLSFLEPARWGDTIGVNPYRGYASLGYLPVLDIAANAGYRFVNKRDTRVGAWLQYNGHNYSAADYTYRDHAFSLGVDASHRFGSVGVLDADASLLAASHNNPLAPAPEGEVCLNKTLGADIDLRWHARSQRLDWGIGLGLDYMGHPGETLVPRIMGSMLSVLGARQTRATLALDGRYAPGSRSALALDFDAEWTHNASRATFGLPILMAERLAPFSTALYRVTPRFCFDLGKFSGHLGARVSILSTPDRTKAYIAPEVRLDFVPSSTFSTFVLFDGSVRQNTLRDIYDMSPRTVSTTVGGYANTKVSATLGINLGRFANVFDASLYTRWDATNGAMMPIVYITTQPATIYDISHFDARGGILGARLGITCRSLFALDVRGEMQLLARDVDNLSHFMAGEYDAARYVLGASVSVNALPRLHLRLGYDLRAVRSLTLVQYTPYVGDGILAEDAISRHDSIMRLRNFSDLRLDAAYDISPRLSVYAHLHNLLCRRNQLVFAVPSARLNGQVGVALKF